MDRFTWKNVAILLAAVLLSSAILLNAIAFLSSDSFLTRLSSTSWSAIGTLVAAVAAAFTAWAAWAASSAAGAALQIDRNRQEGEGRREARTAAGLAHGFVSELRSHNALLDTAIKVFQPGSTQHSMNAHIRFGRPRSGSPLLWANAANTSSFPDEIAPIVGAAVGASAILPIIYRMRAPSAPADLEAFRKIFLKEATFANERVLAALNLLQGRYRI